MIKKLALSLFISVSFFACSKKPAIPPEAVPAGEHMITGAGIQKGMYRCKIFNKQTGSVITDKIFVFPNYYGDLKDGELFGGIDRFDGNAIRFKSGRRIIVSEIPENSVRALSFKGGVWIHCVPIDDAKGTYYCTVYLMKDASVLSEGAYQIKKFAWSDDDGGMVYSEISRPPRMFDIVYYGGIGITLSRKMVLMPEAWVDYPSPKRGGEKILYDGNGDILRREIY